MIILGLRTRRRLCRNKRGGGSCRKERRMERGRLMLRGREKKILRQREGKNYSEGKRGDMDMRRLGGWEGEREEDVAAIRE